MKQDKKTKNVSPLVIIFMAIFAATFIKLFIFDIVIVSGASMQPTIKSGSLALVMPLAYGLPMPFGSGYIVKWDSPKAGDIVIVKAMGKTSRRSIKRVFEAGPAWLTAKNGLLHGSAGTISLDGTNHYNFATDIYIEANRIFIVGDNTDKSSDSRTYGSIPVEKVEAKVVFYFYAF